MGPAGGRFGPQVLSNPFNHIQQSHLQHHTNQHHAPGSAGFPAPSFNTNAGFAHANPSSAVNPFAAVGGTNALAAGFGGNASLGGSGGSGLASHAAVMGFARGDAIQQQQQQSREAMRRGNGTKAQNKSRIRDVWAGNLHQEMQNLRELVERYPFIGMDTEFPGVVARPMGQFTSRADYHYQTLRCNVDLLSVIQLGITLFNSEGETPPANAEYGNAGATYQNTGTVCPTTWQFNFKFSAETDMHNQDSIEFLSGMGMNMEMHENHGIDPKEFGALLISSGLVLLPDVRWISFHSGYDFGYLVKIMLCKALPDDEVEFRKLLSIFFPAIYDIKYMIKSVQRTQTANGAPLTPAAQAILNGLGTRSSLQDLADELGIKRVGAAHQAGSDSLLTGKVFYEVKKSIFNGTLEDEKYTGQVWGLNGIGMASAGQSGLEGQVTPNLNGATIYSNSSATPSTPGTTHPGLAQTPNQQNGSGGMGSLTPGGGVGVFGRFGFK